MDLAPELSNCRSVEFLDGEVRVADGYVLVCNESVPNVLRARKILLTIDRALEISKQRSVMFDTRDMASPTEAVNTLLRAWVDKCRFHDKVALLVKSDLKRIASNMRALSVGVKMRSFHDLGEAEAWLRKPLPRAHARIETPESMKDSATPQPRGRQVTEPIDLPVRRARPVTEPIDLPVRRERPVSEPIDLPLRRERTATEPIALPLRRGRAGAATSESPKSTKRRWRSPLLQGLNED